MIPPTSIDLYLLYYCSLCSSEDLLEEDSVDLVAKLVQTHFFWHSLRQFNGIVVCPSFYTIVLLFVSISLFKEVEFPKEGQMVQENTLEST